MKLIKRFKWLFWSGVMTIALVFAIDLHVAKSTSQSIYQDLDAIPHNKVGLLLGTSKRLISGQPNLYYQYRIDATVDLFQAKKIDYVLVSGDNGTKYYDEPSTIKKDLVKREFLPKELFWTMQDLELWIQWLEVMMFLVRMM